MESTVKIKKSVLSFGKYALYFKMKDFDKNNVQNRRSA